MSKIKDFSHPEMNLLSISIVKTEKMKFDIRTFLNPITFVSGSLDETKMKFYSQALITETFSIFLLSQKKKTVKNII